MGIYEKMHLVMCESEAIEKSMTVGSGQNSYKAVSEAAVLNGIKPLLKKHKLVIFPVKVDIVEDFKEYAGKYGETQRFNSIVKAQYKLVDVDTGESELLETVGYGTDSQDKGSGKAMTYAYKALLQKTFCLFSGEDTDNTHSDDLEKSNSKPQPKPTNLDCNELITIGHSKGYKPEAIDKMIVKKFGHDMQYISKAELTEMIKGFKSLPDKE